MVRTATSNPQFYLRGFSIALGTGYEYYKISSTGHFAVHHILMNHEISDCFLHGEIDPVLVEGLEAASLNPFIDADQGPAHYRNVGNTTNVGTGELQSYEMLIQHSQRQEEKIAEKEAIIYELELARKNMESHVIGLNQELQRKEEQMGILKNENEGFKHHIIILNQDLQGKQEEIETLKNENERFKHHVIALNQELQGKQVMIETLNNENEGYKQHVGDLIQQKKALNQQLTEMSHRSTRMSHQNVQLRGMIGKPLEPEVRGSPYNTPIKIEPGYGSQDIQPFSPSIRLYTPHQAESHRKTPTVHTQRRLAMEEPNQVWHNASIETGNFSTRLPPHNYLSGIRPGNDFPQDNIYPNTGEYNHMPVNPSLIGDNAPSGHHYIPTKIEDTLDRKPIQSSNEKSEMTLVLDKLVNILENKSHIESNKNQVVSPNNRDVIEAKRSIKKVLTLEGLKGGLDKSLKHLSDWIAEVEDNCTSDSLRVRMIQLRADRPIARLLKLDDDNQLKKTSWEELKKMLIAKVPEFDPREAAKRLMKKNLTAEDDIEAFVACLHEEYQEICKATGLSELRPGWSTILAFAITGKMNDVSRALYLNDIINNPDETIRELEKSFVKSKDFQKGLFEEVNKPTERLRTPQQTTATTVGAQQSVYALAPTSSIQGAQQSEHHPYNSTRESQPFQGQVGRNGASSGHGNRLPNHTERQAAFSTWKDWICARCNGNNSGGFYTCGAQNCNGQATQRQVPPDSWQCRRRDRFHRICGQNVWSGDHYCYTDLSANPAIHPNFLREQTLQVRPLPRIQQIWPSQLPSIEP